MTPRTIVYVGNFGPANSTENDIKWTLEDMGHRVVTVQENNCSWHEIAASADEAKADLALFTHTYGYEPRGEWSQGLYQLRKLGVPTAAFHLDLYIGLERSHMVGKHWFFKVDKFFGVDGDPRSEELYRNKGVNHVWLRPGVVKRDCYLAEPVTELTNDVIFVGSRGYHPEWQHRPKLLKYLEDHFGGRYRKYGSPEESIRGRRLNQLYASSKIVVGDTLCLGYTHENYWSDRPCETIGRGGFLLMPYVKGMELDFTNGEHVVYWQFGDWDELHNKIDHYLHNETDRERIRLAGQRHVAANCTYHNRMEFLLSQVFV